MCYVWKLRPQYLAVHFVVYSQWQSLEESLYWHACMPEHASTETTRYVQYSTMSSLRTQDINHVYSLSLLQEILIGSFNYKSSSNISKKHSYTVHHVIA